MPNAAYKLRLLMYLDHNCLHKHFVLGLKCCLETLMGQLFNAFLVVGYVGQLFNVYSGCYAYGLIYALSH